MYFPRDADLERLLEQWDEDEEPLPLDELPEWDPRKPQPEIRMEDMQNQDPEDLLRSAGLTNPILFSLTFKNQGPVHESAFSTNAQSRFASAVSNRVLEAWHTQRCPCFIIVPEATHKVSRGPLKVPVSAQKALQRPETETRELLEGTEENSVSPTRGH